MTLRGRGPWLASVGLHAGVVALGLLWLFREVPPAPSVLRMRLVSPGASPVAGPAQPSAWIPPSPRGVLPPAEPTVPGWTTSTAPAVTEPTAAPTSVSLDELLGPIDKGEPTENPSPSAGDAGWSGPGGLGYAAPPLPPPGLAPPQGAQWSLMLSIPGGGGFARSFEGLDSGHPELDRWLEKYLRTVSFPTSPDGEDYQIRWTLRLESGRPQ